MDKEAVYREFYPKVSGYVRSRLNNAADAEDVVSAIFVKVYANWERYDPDKASLSTWIYAITKNTVINFYAGQRNASLPLEDYAEELRTRDMDPLLDGLAEALETLSGLGRDVVILHYYYGLSHQEIARKTGLSYANARKLCSLSVAKLRKALAG